MKKRKRLKRAAAREPSVEREPERGPRKHEPFERVACVAQAEVRRLTRAISRRRALDFTRRGRARGRPDLTERADVCSRGLLARLWWALGVALCGSFRWQRRQEVADA